ncbi:MAG: ankyrin repeat domain-containing protein, partial [Pirellulales bacterium]|nr:ankyrin repeat domain-containing protein [Pirellulales bacterium]
MVEPNILNKKDPRLLIYDRKVALNTIHRVANRTLLHISCFAQIVLTCFAIIACSVVSMVEPVNANTNVTEQQKSAASLLDHQKRLLYLIGNDDYIGIGNLLRNYHFEKSFINSHGVQAFEWRSSEIQDLIWKARHQDGELQLSVPYDQMDKLRPLVERHLETLKRLLTMGLNPNVESLLSFGPVYEVTLREFWDASTDDGLIESHKVEDLAKRFVMAGVDLLKKYDDQYPILRIRGVDKILYAEMYNQLGKRAVSLDLDLGEGNTLLMLAASDNNVALVQKLLADGADPFLRNEEGLVALELVDSDVFIWPTPPEANEARRHIVRQMAKSAYDSGNLKMFAQKLYRKRREGDAMPMILWAVRLDDSETVQLLLRTGLDPNTTYYRDRRGNRNIAYPLLEAAASGATNAFNVLAAADRTNLHITTTEGVHVLHRAVTGENGELLARTMELVPTLINKRDRKGRLPVEYFFESYHDDGVIRALGPILFRPPFDPNVVITVKQSTNGREVLLSYTPLGRSIHKGYESLIEVLLGLPDIDVNLADDVYGITPLMYAAKFGSEDLFKRLIKEKNAEYRDIADVYGDTILFYLVQATVEKPALLQWFLNQYPEKERRDYVNKINTRQHSAVFEVFPNLYSAILYRRSKTNARLIPILDSYGADFRIRDIDGNTIT